MENILLIIIFFVELGKRDMHHYKVHLPFHHMRDTHH
jgi:hypothetical protein